MKKRLRDPRVYLEDILSAISKIEEYTKEGAKDFFSDEKTQDAVIRQISIIGEAASHLSKSEKDKQPKIPWKRIIGMRNILVHDYASLKADIIWKTVDRNLPRLKRAIEKMLQEK